MTKLKFTTAYIYNIASRYNTSLFAKLQFYLIELLQASNAAIAGSCDRLIPNSQKQKY